MSDMWTFICIFFLVFVLVLLAVGVLGRPGHSKPPLKQAPWEQLEGRTHREGQAIPIPAEDASREEKNAFALAMLRRHGFTVDQKKLDKLLDPTVDDTLEEQRNIFDGSDPLETLFRAGVQSPETRDEAMQRQEREQTMFGGPPKKPGGDEAA